MHESFTSPNTSTRSSYKINFYTVLLVSFSADSFHAETLRHPLDKPYLKERTFVVTFETKTWLRTAVCLQTMEMASHTYFSFGVPRCEDQQVCFARIVSKPWAKVRSPRGQPMCVRRACQRAKQKSPHKFLVALFQCVLSCFRILPIRLPRHLVFISSPALFHTRPTHEGRAR